MDGLSDILAGKAIPREPPEVRRIKAYVKAEFDRDVGVQINGTDVVILAPTSVLANALRLRLHELRRICGMDLKEDSARKLMVRMGRSA